LIKARAARLRNAAAQRRSRWLDSLVGTVQPVLVENHGKGHSDTFAPIFIRGSERGQAGRARITSRAADHLVGAFE
jgi:threonylcarbamoyladenosine tRNA methylthiotransferase MtaB